MLTVFGVLAIAHEARAQESPLPTGYSLRTMLQLTEGPDRMSGQLQLLEDARIRPEMEQAIRESWGGNPCLDNPRVLRELCNVPNGEPLRPALLRIIDSNGQVIATRLAERPIASLVRKSLYGNRPSSRRTYFFTIDLSAGVGSYSGPFTRLAEPSHDGFNWLVDTDTVGQHADTLALISTLKSGWGRSPRLTGDGMDLLMVRCQPAMNTLLRDTTVSFILTFERFSFEHGHWVRRSRTESGCWESDDRFPARSRFP
jgi:hypothetical protein